MQSELDFSQRLANGVRARADGKGNPWAECHRRELGNRYYLHDVDGCFGMLAFGANTAERLFLEYVPDRYEQRACRRRNFAVVALFDRKQTCKAAFSDHNILSTAWYLWQCRVFADRQPVPPKFFFVIGGNDPPWELHELNIEDGTPCAAAVVLERANWAQVWRTVGLQKLRDDLRPWVEDLTASSRSEG